MLKKDKVFLFTYPEKKLAKQQWQKYKKLIARRKKHEPIAYITHHKEFFGLGFFIDRRVLIPRPETEKLVEKVIKYLNANRYPLNAITICDIGTGSGCIAIALAKNLLKTNHYTKRSYGVGVKIYAIDSSKKALQVAKINVKKHKVLKRVKFIHSDLLSNVPASTKFDIIVANLPYLSKKEYQRTSQDIKKYEPKLALCAGENGNEIYKNLLSQAQKHLKKDGQIFFESNSHLSTLKAFCLNKPKKK